MDELESQLRRLIVTTLRLKDFSAADFGDDTPLFRNGLELDSIDAFELVLAIHEHFGVRVDGDDTQHRDTLRSVGTIAAFLRRKGVARSSTP